MLVYPTSLIINQYSYWHLTSHFHYGSHRIILIKMGNSMRFLISWHRGINSINRPIKDVSLFTILSPTPLLSASVKSQCVLGTEGATAGPARPYVSSIWWKEEIQLLLLIILNPTSSIILPLSRASVCLAGKEVGQVRRGGAAQFPLSCERRSTRTAAAVGRVGQSHFVLYDFN